MLARGGRATAFQSEVLLADGGRQAAERDQDNEELASAVLRPGDHLIGKFVNNAFSLLAAFFFFTTNHPP